MLTFFSKVISQKYINPSSYLSNVSYKNKTILFDNKNKENQKDKLNLILTFSVVEIYLPHLIKYILTHECINSCVVLMNNHTKRKCY